MCSDNHLFIIKMQQSIHQFPDQLLIKTIFNLIK